uniref:C-type lectin LmsL-like isoform X2 n=1 Tax=Pristiophorus japonicus TaxID=55135 RepID=UPI00398F8B06
MELAFLWTDGSLFDYTNWDVKQPDDHQGKENCVEIIPTHVALNRALENGQPETETDQGQDLGKHHVPEIGPCPDGWDHFHHLPSCYKFFSEKKTWIDAEVYCQAQARGGHLTSIHWVEQNESVVQFIISKDKTSPVTWIGLNDNHKEQYYFWTDGSVTDFTNWLENEPNNYEGSEHCVQINTDVPGAWSDVPCTHQNSFICSYKLD